MLNQNVEIPLKPNQTAVLNESRKVIHSNVNPSNSKKILVRKVKKYIKSKSNLTAKH